MGEYVAAAALVYSVYQQGEAQKKQEQAYEAEKRKADYENVYKARQAVRQARIAQSQMLAQAALTGGMGSSGLAGGMSSVQSQLGGNLNYMANIAAENTNIANAQIGAAKASSNAAIAGTIGQFAGSKSGQTMFDYFNKPSGK